MTLAVNIAQSGSNNVTFRNRIINGAMVIAQRGTSAVTTSGSFPVDRFSAASNANDFTAIQNTTVPSSDTFVYSVSIQPTATKTPSASTYAAISTNVEGFNMQGLGWGTSSAKAVTVSFWVRSSKTGTYSISTKNAGASRTWCQEYTINSANTWEQKTYTITGCPDGSWPLDNTRGMTLDFWLAGQNTQSSTVGSWYSGNINMSSNQVNFFDSTSNTFYITGVQLEAGTTASPFEYRQYGTELGLCQRYFQTWGGNSTYERIATGYAVSSTQIEVFVPRYYAPMRSAPSLSVNSASNFRASDAGTSYTATAVAISQASPLSCGIIVTVSSGLTQYRAMSMDTNNTTSALLSLSAEL
jgi:hypothetical protein